MKKIIALLVTFVLCFSLTACSNSHVTDGEFTNLLAKFGDEREFEIGETLDITFITMPTDYDISNIDLNLEGDEIATFEYHDGIVTLTFIKSGIAEISFYCDGETSNSTLFTVLGDDTSSSDHDDAETSIDSGSAPSGSSSGGASNNSNAQSVSSSSTGSTSQRTALDRAKSYLSSMAFSRQGLIDQLEYEGFSTSDATYAVDHVGADWNAQAIREAKSYLRSMPFSYSGLIDQLEYEGFTSSQATYGADNCGANWNEQAALKARDYMEIFSYSRQELIDQLKYEGFTTSQAEYGANAVGL